VDGALVLWRFSESAQLTRELNARDFSHGSVGATVVEMQKEFPHREVVLFERTEVEDWLKSGAKLTHFSAFAEMVRERATQNLTSKKIARKNLLSRDHFLLEALGGWWGKLLPSVFGLYLHLDNGEGRERTFFVIYRRGKVESYDIPDFTGFNRPAGKEREAAVKFLSERYSVTVQGLFLSESQWQIWSGDADPWKKIAKSFKENSNQLVPFKMSLAAMIGGKAFF